MRATAGFPAPRTPHPVPCYDLEVFQALCEAIRELFGHSASVLAKELLAVDGVAEGFGPPRARN